MVDKRARQCWTGSENEKRTTFANELEKQVLPTSQKPLSQLEYSALTQILHEDTVNQITDVVLDIQCIALYLVQSAMRSNEEAPHGPYPAREKVSQKLNQQLYKANLITLLVAEWNTTKLRDELNDKQLYVARLARTKYVLYTHI